MDHPVLVGHSMGGATALRLALDHPDFPRAIVLAGSGAKLRMRPAMIEAARQRAEAAQPGRVVERLVSLDEAVSPHANPDVRAWLGQRFGQSTGQAVYADFLATNGFDVMDRVEEIRVPTLIIAGEDDLWTPPKFQHFLAERIPGARLVLLPQTGHYPFVEQPDRFNAELDRFLASL
jgi:pimeloyl-ACP methyl ester carboxylesterase